MNYHFFDINIKHIYLNIEYSWCSQNRPGVQPKSLIYVPPLLKIIAVTLLYYAMEHKRFRGETLIAFVDGSFFRVNGSFQCGTS